MGEIQGSGEEAQRKHLEANEATGRTGVEALEAERRRNAVEMEKRVTRIREHMASEKYPMTPDNPLYNASDDEVRAYIRKRREEFMRPGGKWEAHVAERARLEAQRIAKEKR